jgi:hypothetical protein
MHKFLYTYQLIASRELREFEWLHIQSQQSTGNVYCVFEGYVSCLYSTVVDANLDLQIGKHPKVVHSITYKAISQSHLRIYPAYGRLA